MARKQEPKLDLNYLEGGIRTVITGYEQLQQNKQEEVQALRATIEYHQRALGELYDALGISERVLEKTADNLKKLRETL